MRETLSPLRFSVAHTFRTPQAGSSWMTARIAVSTTSLDVCRGARGSATTFAAGFPFLAA